MTREEFFDNINNLNKDDILQAFDSLMAFFNFYNVIGVYENVEITKTDPELGNFDVVFDTEFDIDKFCKEYGGLNIRIYGVVWNVRCEKKDGNTMHISLVL